jgi:hypothetical protein
VVAVLQWAGTVVAGAGSAIHLAHFRSRYAGAYEGLKAEIGLGPSGEVREAVIGVIEAAVVSFEDVQAPSRGELAIPPEVSSRIRRNRIAEHESRHDLCNRLRQLYVADHALDQVRKWQRTGDRFSAGAFLALLMMAVAGVGWALLRTAASPACATIWMVGMFAAVAATTALQLCICSRMETQRDRAREAASLGRKRQ